MTRLGTGRRLHLAVTNPEALEYGCRPAHSFGTAGGTIGGRGTSWPLSDRGGRIAPLHSEIVGIDGTFCLVDRSGLTRINGAPEPLGADRIVRLADGDTLQVGPYRVNVHIGDANDESVMSMEDRSLDDILATPGPLDDGDEWQDGLSGYRVTSETVASDDEQLDPLLALDAAAARHRGESSLDPTHYGLSARQESPPDRADTMVEAFRDRHFLAIPTRNGAGELSRPQDDAPEAVRPSVPHAPATTPALYGGSVAQDALRNTLRERTAAQIRHEDALLRAVDDALRVVLERTGDADGKGASSGSQEDGWKHEEAVAMFWQTCEGAYRRRLEQRDA